MNPARALPPDWAAIDHVILDMDGTLLDLHFDNQVWNELLPRRYAQVHRMPERPARARVQELLAGARGTLSWYCLDHWSEVFAFDMGALEGELQHLIGLRAGARDFLHWLNRHGRRPLLATNAHPRSLRRKLALTGIDGYFSGIVSAHAIGAPKESIAFWQGLDLRHPFQPARTMLVDDNQAVLAAAAEWGVAHLFGIRRPDSRRDCLPAAAYPCIDQFADITGTAQAAPSSAKASS